MTWEDLTKDNLETVKNMYIEYLQENKNNKYTANLYTFEEFMNNELTKCMRCETPIYNENTYCECCEDEV